MMKYTVADDGSEDNLPKPMARVLGVTGKATRVEAGMRARTRIGLWVLAGCLALVGACGSGSSTTVVSRGDGAELDGPERTAGCVRGGDSLWCGQWLTYEVEFVQDAWVIIGTTGEGGDA